MMKKLLDPKQNNLALIVKPTQLNEFTKELRRLCLKKDSKVIIQTRTGELFQVKYVEPNKEYGPETPMFDSVLTSHRWNANGASIQNSCFDILHLIKN